MSAKGKRRLSAGQGSSAQTLRGAHTHPSIHPSVRSCAISPWKRDSQDSHSLETKCPPPRLTPEQNAKGVPFFSSSSQMRADEFVSSPHFSTSAKTQTTLIVRTHAYCVPVFVSVCFFFVINFSLPPLCTTHKTVFPFCFLFSYQAQEREKHPPNRSLQLLEPYSHHIPSESSLLSPLTAVLPRFHSIHFVAASERAPNWLRSLSISTRFFFSTRAFHSLPARDRRVGSQVEKKKITNASGSMVGDGFLLSTSFSLRRPGCTLRPSFGIIGKRGTRRALADVFFFAITRLMLASIEHGRKLLKQKTRNRILGLLNTSSSTAEARERKQNEQNGDGRRASSMRFTEALHDDPKSDCL